MRNVVALLLAIVIVFFALTLGKCVFDNKISQEAKNQIIEDYYIEYGYEIPSDELDKWYCGTYRGNIAFYHSWGGAFFVVTTVNVGGVEFTYPDSRQVLIYSDGEFYTMGAAYEMGLIGYLDIYIIFYKYEMNVLKERIELKAK